MKQNKNFNFQSMSSANEKMLIIFSWIIVVIIIVLVGLYYGQQVREQEVSAARVQSSAASADVEVSSDSGSRIEEGEMSAKSAESVLTDSMALNRNEVFCVQVGSPDGPDNYSAERAASIISEFSSRGLYSKKIIVNPEKDHYMVQLGIFKNYEDAKTFLNTVKLKNYPAEITIVPDPNAKIDNAPAVARAVSAVKKDPPKELVVSTPDAKLVGEINSSPVPANTAENKPAETPAAAAPPVKTAPEIASTRMASKEPDKVTAPVEAPSRTAEKETAAKPPALSTAPAAEEKPAAKPSQETAPKPDFRIAAAKPEDKKTQPAAAALPEEEAAAEEIKSAAPPKKEAKAPAKETKASSKPAAASEEDDEIIAGEDDLEIVAEDEAAAPAEGGKGPYYIQIGTYKSNKNADALKAKLKKMGISNVAIVPGKVSSGDSVYRVRMTGYASKDAAGKAFGGIKGAFPDVKPYISK